MMRKRRVWRFLCLLLGLAFLTASGCGGKGKEEEAAGGTAETKEALLSERNELPEDGVVTKEEMASIAGQAGTVEFFGETPEGVSYTWAYSPKNIKNPEEQRLKVVCATEGLSELKEKAGGAEYGLGIVLEKFHLAADAKLSLVLAEKWDAEEVSLYKNTEQGLKELAGAKVSEKDGKTELSFGVTETGDTYYLMGKKAKAQAESTEGGTENSTESSEPESGAESAQAGAEGAPAGTEGSQGTGAPGTSGEGQGTSGGQAEAQTPDVEAPPETKAPETKAPAPETHTCTISIECSTILSNWDSLDAAKAPYVPGDGWILGTKTVEFTPGDTVYDVLVKVCGQYGIHMESSYTPAYGSYYIEGINQLYEFDCGNGSGWMYRVNGWYPNYGCSSYEVEDGDSIEWKYTCDLGSDVGGGF